MKENFSAKSHLFTEHKSGIIWSLLYEILIIKVYSSVALIYKVGL